MELVRRVQFQYADFAGYAVLAAFLCFAMVSNSAKSPAHAAQPVIASGNYAALQAPGSMVEPPGGLPRQLGLIQVGVVSLSRLEADGRFGQATPMPLLQIVQLQPVAGTAPATAQNGPVAPGARAADAAPPSVDFPTAPMTGGYNGPVQGAQISATPCDVNGVRVLTAGAAACQSISGQVATF